ncbi:MULTISPECIES: hypothetical protein [Anaerostipes]|uniref:Uncharacterized protein n=2 Tax=Anaerostipes TaxID=207244 RepID=A0ABV4DJ42_9FIRM|nr:MULTISPECIES: hypothetical protein [Anaerostipes]MBC5677243.1 hypothetical protein [Anaerostipes hominis (ex Liu et al. 2021)]
MKRMKRIMTFLLALSLTLQSCLAGGCLVAAEEGEGEDTNGVVIVRYLEEGTNKVLSKEYEETGVGGAAYKGPNGDGDLSHISIDGYDFVKTIKPEELAEDSEKNPIWDEDSCNSTFLNGKTQIITHYYESNEGSVKLRFVDADTKKEILAEDNDPWASYQETGKGGEAYKGRNHDGFMGKVSIPGYIYYQTLKPDKIATDEEGNPIWDEDTCNSIFIKGEHQVITHEYIKLDTSATNSLNFSKSNIGNGCDVTLIGAMKYLGNTDADSITMKISIPKVMKARSIKIPAAKAGDEVKLKISCLIENEHEQMVLEKESDAAKPLEVKIPSKAVELILTYHGKIKNAGFYREHQSNAFSVGKIEVLGQAIYEGKKESHEVSAKATVSVKKDGIEEKKEEKADSFQIFAPEAAALEISAPEYTHRYDNTHMDIDGITYHGPFIPVFQARVSVKNGDVSSMLLPDVEGAKNINAMIRTNQRTHSYENVKSGGTLNFKKFLSPGEQVEEIIIEFYHIKSLKTSKKGSIILTPSYDSMKDGERATLRASTRAYTTKEGNDGNAYYRSSNTLNAGVRVSSAKISGTTISMPNRILRGEDFVLKMKGFENLSTAHVDGMQSTMNFSAPVIIKSFEKGESGGESDGTAYEYMDGGVWRPYDEGKVNSTTGIRITVTNPSRGFAVQPKINLRQAEQDTKVVKASVRSRVYDGKKTYMEEYADSEIRFYDMKGTFSFSQEKGTLVSGETKQVYRMAFHKDDNPSGFSQIGIRISLDEKFLAETLNLGTWSDYDGSLRVTCRTKDGSLKEIGTYQKGAVVSLKRINEDLKEIQIKTQEGLGSESYAEGIKITGRTQKQPKTQKILAKADFDAVYGRYKQKIHDEKSLESKVYYYAITVPIMKLKKDGLYYGDKTIITLSNVATMGNCSAKKLDASILIPEKVSVEKILLPSFRGIKKASSLVFVFDNQMSKTIKAQGSYIPNKSMKKYIREIHFVQEKAPGGIKMDKGVTVAIKNESKVKRAFLSSASLKAEFGDGLKVSKQSDIYNVRLLAKKKDMVVDNNKKQKVQEIEDVPEKAAKKKPVNNTPFVLLAIGLCSAGFLCAYWMRRKKQEDEVHQIDPS